MNLLTVGFPFYSDMDSLMIEVDLTQLGNEETTIFVSAKGVTREVWRRLDPFSPSFKLQGVLPTVCHKAQINTFLEKGGKIISSLVNPADLITGFAFIHELPTFIREEITCLNEEDGLIEYQYSPYNWLPEELQEFAIKSYDLHSSIDTEWEDETSATVTHCRESFIYHLGNNGGKIIFTSLINDGENLRSRKDFEQIGMELLGKGEFDNVVTR